VDQRHHFLQEPKQYVIISQSAHSGLRPPHTQDRTNTHDLPFTGSTPSDTGSQRAHSQIVTQDIHEKRSSEGQSDANHASRDCSRQTTALADLELISRVFSSLDTVKHQIRHQICCFTLTYLASYIDDSQIKQS